MQGTYQESVKKLLCEAKKKACKELIESISVQYDHQSIFDTSFIEMQISLKGKLIETHLISIN